MFCNDFSSLLLPCVRKQTDPSLVTLSLHLEELQPCPSPCPPAPKVLLCWGIMEETSLLLLPSPHLSWSEQGWSSDEASCISCIFLYLLHKVPGGWLCKARIAMSISKHTVLLGKFSSTWDSESAS